MMAACAKSDLISTAPKRRSSPFAIERITAKSAMANCRRSQPQAANHIGNLSTRPGWRVRHVSLGKALVHKAKLVRPWPEEPELTS
ncbi:MAG: hypothetical protein ACI91B_003952 [Planctomycetota bacterium]|jgi:hypothetical protein